jgi:replication factor C subunit 3/5
MEFSSHNTTVWVEKYRPQTLDQIVLDHVNKSIFHNILETGHFPNLLLHGPPGTGKTTAIINLIQAYQEKWNPSHTRIKELVIHLNASDERGIDVIRNQIIFFIESKPLFRTGRKFVILDEVDYMTKNAQQALRYLLQSYTKTARFCLICNYVSKIDPGLLTELIHLRFNQLSKEEICLFLKNICEKENVALSSAMIAKIQTMFFSDIRSMINYIQSNQFFLQQAQAHNTFIDDTVWEKGYQELKECHRTTFIEQVFIDNETNPHSDTKSLIKQFLLFLIRKEIHQEEKHEEKDEEKEKDESLIKILSMSSTLMHHPFINTATQIGFLISKLAGLYSNSKAAECT